MRTSYYRFLDTALPSLATLTSWKIMSEWQELWLRRQTTTLKTTSETPGSLLRWAGNTNVLIAPGLLALLNRQT